MEHQVSTRTLKGGEIRATCSCGKWSISGRIPDAVNEQIEFHERKNR